MDIAVLGIDLGKNSCSVVELDRSGKVVLRPLHSLRWRPAAERII